MYFYLLLYSYMFIYIYLFCSHMFLFKYAKIIRSQQAWRDSILHLCIIMCHLNAICTYVYIYIYYTHYPFVNTSTTTIRHGMCHILSRIWSCTVHMSSNITSSQPNTITWHLYRISSSITTTTMAKPVEWLIHLPFQSLCPSCLVWL